MKHLLDFWITQPLIMQRIKRAFFRGRDPELQEEILFVKFLNSQPSANVLWQLYKQGGEFIHEPDHRQKTAIH